jgi:ribosomal protection tetracycline resistance protein
LRDELATQTGQGLVHPVFFGSAITGAGVDSLMTGIAELLPAAHGDAGGPASATVFKIERDPAGGRIAYVRMFSGTIRVRDRLDFGRDAEEKVTAISVFDGGSDVRRASVSAGEIGKLWGLREVQIGDSVGGKQTVVEHQFAPPTLETVVAPRHPDDQGALRVVLGQLAEQDPLIDVRQDDANELSVSLYGEVQKEVIQTTLASDYGLDVTFRETTTICIERPLGTGEAVELLHAESNPFPATIGLRVEPARDGSGIEFRLQVDARTLPLYVYKTADSFGEHMEQYVRAALKQGLFGWQVTDCVVTLTRCTYSIPDGPPSRRGPPSTAADFRKLTPLVVRQALERARTVVCEPIVRVSLEIPTDTIGTVLPTVARLGGAAETRSLQGTLATVETILAATRAHELQRQLAGLTGGEGVLESSFAGYQPVSGDPPTRRALRGS